MVLLLSFLLPKNVTLNKEPAMPLKIVKIEVELLVDTNECDTSNKEVIADYLTDKLYDDPEYFGQIETENIKSVEDPEPMWFDKAISSKAYN